jgi:hypothetical protein
MVLLGLDDQLMSPAVGFLTGWLIMGTICAVWLAFRVRPKPFAGDLEHLHRVIDQVRDQLAQTDGEGPRATELRRVLRTLMQQLPEDDLRRRYLA